MNKGATIVVHKGVSGECVGVSDGSYDFSPALATVDKLIAKENQWVLDQHAAYVSVAYLAPMTIANADIQTTAHLLHDVEGAYAAQDFANHNNLQGTAPLIRLLLVNDGSQADQWRPAVSDILADVSSQHAVAIAGLGASLATTKEAVLALSAAGIPMVGATLTADDFDNIRGLVRVAAPNSDEVAAALSYIKPLARTATLIEDVNQGDSYAGTLAAEFSARFPDSAHSIVDKETYDTGLPYGAVSNRISQMTAEICARRPEVVLFAGRGRDLTTLIQALGNRPCLDYRFRVISGDDASQVVARANVQPALRSGINVYYTALASPEEWSQGSGPAIEAGRKGLATLEGVFGSAFPGQSLDDGQAIMAYDATISAISAIRLAGPQPSASAVESEFSALHGQRAVQGAGGLIGFYGLYNGPGSDGSNPVNKAIPILQVQPDGGISFVKLTWPNGPLPVG
jgi:ABC-type branched-subunit amino acid transport system substrate-binding protein